MALMKTGFVYKLVSKDIDVKECYVGSTGNITKRKNCHKSDFNKATGKHYNYRVYQYIRDNSGFANWEMIIIETVQYEQKYELKARERHHMETLGATLNSCVPNRTVAGWRGDNAEHIKQYQQDNAEQLKQKNKQYYENNKETENQRCKQDQQDNAEHIKQKQKQYRENNKEKLHQKHDCPCGGKYTYQKKSRHMKSKKHLTYLENNEII